MQTNNISIAKLLRSVATALTLDKANQFQTRAYENAATSIEHSPVEVKDLWQEGKMDEISGLGEKLQAHLEELFKTGEVKHFNQLLKKHPAVIYELVEVPGIGPKTALEVANLGIKSVDRLQKELKNGQLVKKGLSDKLAAKLLNGLVEFGGRTERTLLYFADQISKPILEYLKKDANILAADATGSLRRRLPTVGDLDFVAAAKDLKAAVDYFLKMPGIKEVVNRGDDSAVVVLESGYHIDLLVGRKDAYGALLQHFTGSKAHNIKLREYAITRGLSLSEQGLKKKSGQMITVATELAFYEELKMELVPVEIREDSGEIEAAIDHKLPKLIEYDQIKGDLHLHSNFPLEPSHGPGLDSLEAIVKNGQKIGYEYIGLSDHPPAVSTHSEKQLAELIRKRSEAIAKLKANTKGVRVLNGLEIDINQDGTLSVPNDVLKTLDYCIAGIHSAHRTTEKAEMTKRIIGALENPYVKIISHPTGRLLGKRDSFEADWEKIFKCCVKNQKLLEINAAPERMDLREDLVRMAIGMGVKLIINSDAHQVSRMNVIPYGISVARRGWATKADIVNTWEWSKLQAWWKI